MTEKCNPDWEKWGINYLSPSHINKYKNCKSAWLAHYLYGVKEEGLLPAAVRGQCVETGIEQYLMGQKIEDAVEVSKKQFMENVERVEEETESKIPSVLYDSEYVALEQYVRRGCSNFDKLLDEENAKNLGFQPFKFLESDEADRRLSIQLEDFDIELMGYYDFAFMCGDDTVKIDNKATGRMPTFDKSRQSDIVKFVQGKEDHRLQVSFYAKSSNEDMAMLSYSTPKNAGFAILLQKEIDTEYRKLLSIINSLSSILYVYERATDGDVEKSKYLLSKTAPISSDIETFYWKGKQDYIDRALEKVKAWSEYA